jgi:hypothetical protein
MQPQIQTAIARLLTDRLCARLGAVVRQDHAPAPSTDVARDEVASGRHQQPAPSADGRNACDWVLLSMAPTL